MKVHLECAEDIWLQVVIPDVVSIDSFLERVQQIEHVIARDRSTPRVEIPRKSPDVQDRLHQLEASTEKIISLLDSLR